jgi:hypothetical protein
VASYFHFGKYMGQPITAAPSDYLCWVLNNVGIGTLTAFLRSAIEKELENRNRRANQPPPPPPPPSLLLDIRRRWFAKLSLAYHPDRGGTDEQMRVVNRAREILEQVMEEATS